MNRFAFGIAAAVSALAIGSAAHAADLIIEEPAEVGVVDVAGIWEGPYVGVFGGYAWGTYEDTGPVGGAADIEGWLLGVTAGADFAVTDGVIAGVVADVAWSDVGFDLSDVFEDNTFDLDWVGSVRGKLGLDGGTFLPYLTAGLAVAGTTAFYDDGFFLVDESQVHVGWTAGAGVEVAVADGLSVDLQYRYSDYGDVTYGGVTSPTYVASFTTHQITAGLNWRF